MNRVIGTIVWVVLLTTSLASDASENAAWMSSNWGIRVVLPAGNNSFTNQFDPAILVQQLATLKTPKWVMVNATQGGDGGYFTIPINKLTQHIDKSIAPPRNLLGEAVKLLRDNGFRVIVYFAADGPAGRNRKNVSKSMHQTKQILKRQAITQAWERLLKVDKLTNEDAVSKYILEPIAASFGTDIDGWWFDHGKWGNANKYISSVRKGNPAAAIAWNEKHGVVICNSPLDKQNYSVWIPKISNNFEDYTAGHITPTRRMSPWNKCNESAINEIEKMSMHSVSNIKGLLPHWFVPIQRGWRRGEANFPIKQLLNWTTRILKSGGAITWAVALEQPEFTNSELGKEQYRQLKILDEYLLNEGLTLPR